MGLCSARYKPSWGSDDGHPWHNRRRFTQAHGPPALLLQRSYWKGQGQDCILQTAFSPGWHFVVHQKGFRAPLCDRRAQATAWMAEVQEKCRSKFSCLVQPTEPQATAWSVSTHGARKPCSPTQKIRIKQVLDLNESSKNYG